MALARRRLHEAHAVIADRESGAGGASCQTYANHTNASREGFEQIGDHQLVFRDEHFEH